MIPEQFPHLFAVFVLVVSVFLSFVLRKLIRELQNLKQVLAKDLLDFTGRVVEKNPSLENYYQLALLCFRYERYSHALLYFDRLLSEGMYEKESHYYRILCLLGLGRVSEAKQEKEQLLLDSYSQGELLQLQRAFSRKKLLRRAMDYLMSLLLTHVPLQYGLQGDGLKEGDPDFAIRAILAGLPRRYRDILLQGETPVYREFKAFDLNLKRHVTLRVLKLKIAGSVVEEFLAYPRILARFYSRVFPQVYDLQTEGLVYYSLELFQGKNLREIFSSYTEQGKVVDFFRQWLGIFRIIEILEDGDVGLNRFSLLDFGVHDKKEMLMYLGPLGEMENLSEQELLKRLQSVFFRDYFSWVEKSFSDEGAESLFAEFKDRFHECADLHQLQFIFSSIVDRLRVSHRTELLNRLEQLRLLEAIHRASVHGLKGKFSVYKRYEQTPQKLIDVFFRESNIEDVIRKLDFLSQQKQALLQLCAHGGYAVCDEIVEMDFGGLILQLKSLFEKNDHQCDASLNFLRGQYSLFTRLSRTLSEFLERHSWSVSMAIHSALERCSEASRIRLQTESDSEQWKFRLLERQLFSEKLFLILENLTNNAFEAGAALVTIRLARLEEELVEIVVEDDGPGLPEHIFKELLANPGYALAGGKSGLVTSRNACESLGGSFLIDCDLKAGCRIRLQLPCFKV